MGLAGESDIQGCLATGGIGCERVYHRRLIGDLGKLCRAVDVPVHRETTSNVGSTGGAVPRPA